MLITILMPSKYSQLHLIHNNKQTNNKNNKNNYLTACFQADDARMPARGGVRVFNDAYGALAAGTGGRLRGVALVSGTGSIAVGVGEKNGERVSVRSGNV